MFANIINLVLVSLCAGLSTMDSSVKEEHQWALEVKFKFLR